jgi:SAM-dependent methyltransferase
MSVYTSLIAGVSLALLHSCTGFKPATFLSHRLSLRLQATLEESVVNKPNLKVPSNAWKWPAAWPFPQDFLDPASDYEPLTSTDPALSGAFYRHAQSFMETEESSLIVGTSFDTSDDRATFPGAEFFSIDGDSPSLTLPFAANSFSTVVFRSGVEHFTKPTEAFTELWRVTKPGGKCFVCFSGKPQLPAPLAPVKMWQTMSDEQKIWITGSYFHYSTLGGWENIEGYDVLGSSGNESLVFANSTSAADQSTAYVVQSAKMVLPSLEELDGTTNQNLSAAMQMRLLGIGNLEADDRKFVSVRLAAQYNASTSDAQKAQLVDSIDRLDSIYSVLKGRQRQSRSSAWKQL